jgi:hypothetical protein
MNRTKRHVLSAILAITLLLLPSTVFAKELGLLTISGPGIKGEVTVDDASVLRKLEGSGFFDQSNMLKQAPENLGEGYTITSQLNLDGKMTPFIEMVYYPVEEGQPGYIHVTGRLDGTTLRKVDEWSKLPTEADKFFRTVMTAKDVTLQSAIVAAPAVVAEAAPQAQPEAQSVSAPVSSPAPVQVPYPALALSAVVLVLLGGALLLRRRAVSQRSV